MKAHDTTKIGMMGRLIKRKIIHRRNREIEEYLYNSTNNNKVYTIAFVHFTEMKVLPPRDRTIRHVHWSIGVIHAHGPAPLPMIKVKSII